MRDAGPSAPGKWRVSALLPRRLRQFRNRSNIWIKVGFNTLICCNPSYGLLKPKCDAVPRNVHAPLRAGPDPTRARKGGPLCFFPRRWNTFAARTFRLIIPICGCVTQDVKSQSLVGQVFEWYIQDEEKKNTSGREGRGRPPLYNTQGQICHRARNGGRRFIPTSTNSDRLAQAPDYQWQDLLHLGHISTKL